MPPFARPAAIASLIPPQPVAPPLRIPELDAVSRQANSQTAHGFSSEAAARSIPPGPTSSPHCTRLPMPSIRPTAATLRIAMLSEGLQVLDEVDDFAPQCSDLLSDADVFELSPAIKLCGSKVPRSTG